MIGLDTNVLVRYIAQDDVAQSAKATKLIESFTASSPGFVPQIVLAELVWVMQSCYQATRANLIAMLDVMLHSDSLVIEQADVAQRALRRFQKTPQVDFADCLIERAAHAAGCTHMVTFDRKAAKGAGMKLIG